MREHFISASFLVFCILLTTDGYLFGKHRQARRLHEKMSDSDFMGEIARSRVTTKTLAESSSDAKGLGQFTAPSNFERDELLRVLAEINEQNVSWFQLTLFAQKRYAKSVMCILDSPSALDIVSSTTSSSGTISLGTAADGLWRVTLSNEDIYKSWAKGMQIFLNIRNAQLLPSKTLEGQVGDAEERGTLFEQIIQLPLPRTGIVPSRIRRVGTVTNFGKDGSMEYSFKKTIVTWLGRDWELPSMGDSVPSGCLGVSYMDGKVWLDVRGLTGETTRSSAEASKFTILTYMGTPKENKDWDEC